MGLDWIASAKADGTEPQATLGMRRLSKDDPETVEAFRSIWQSYQDAAANHVEMRPSVRQRWIRPFEEVLDEASTPTTDEGGTVTPPPLLAVTGTQKAPVEGGSFMVDSSVSWRGKCLQFCYLPSDLTDRLFGDREGMISVEAALELASDLESATPHPPRCWTSPPDAGPAGRALESARLTLRQEQEPPGETHMAFDLIPRATIDEIDGYRRQALELYGAAYDALQAAHKTAGLAVASRALYAMPELTFGTHHKRYIERGREPFVAEVTKQLDRAIWEHLLQATKLDLLMDRTAKDQFRAQVEKDPPPATAENCRATLETLVADRDMIFRRGLAKAFSSLDRRFRSHDGFKIGERLVFSYYANSDGYVSSGGRADSILDVERVFFLLDGKQPPERYGGILGALDAAHREKTGTGWGAAQYEAASDYFRAKVFKNGNAHFWFKRDDLVQRANELLADYYGAAVGASPDVADREHRPKGGIAKSYGFFPTPAALAAQVCNAAGLYAAGECSPSWLEEQRRKPAPAVLEPSAGGAAIAEAARLRGAAVTCVELHPDRAAELKACRFPTLAADFLKLSPDALPKFDLVLMNPPFDDGRDVDHVTHALRFLRPGGRLVAIMSAGVEFRQDAKTADFRAQIERRRGRFADLPEGSFKEAGTMVNTVLLTVTA